MQITPVDEFNDLFNVIGIMPQYIVDHVLNTDWLSLPWQRQEGQESWPRRRIDDSMIPWIGDWVKEFTKIIPEIETATGRKLNGYQGTAWWLDEPGFTCALHTDGELPASCQLMWIGALPNLGTTFFNYKDPSALRYQFPMTTNTGYVMINLPDETGYRHLQWHGMLNPVPQDTFRLCSYSWLSEKVYK